MRKLSFVSICLVQGLILAFIITFDAVAQSSPQCFYDNNGKVEKIPVCEIDKLEQAQFKTEGLPNPLTGCYIWNDDITKSGVEVACDDPKIAKPESFGTSSEAPDEATLGPAPTTSDIKTTEYTGNPEFKCGDAKDDSNEVYPSFDIGCRGEGNAIVDMLFAFIRILSGGIGLALIGSVIYAGFEYATASGDPNKTGLAKKRLVSTLLVALPIYLLTYAILNWIVPGAIF